jgi:hypothetical protein
VTTSHVGALGALEGDPGTFAFYSLTATPLLGVHDPQVSSFGRASFGDAVLNAGQRRTYERAIAVGDRSDVASALDWALGDLSDRGIREIGTVRGRVELAPEETISADPQRRPLVILASAHPSTGSLDPTQWTPDTAVRVEEDGTFEALVVAGTPALVGEVAYEVRLPGHASLRGSSGQRAACGQPVDLGTLTLAPAPTLRIEVRDDSSGTPVGFPARVVVYGSGATPDPVFGPIDGGSPAGNVAYTDGDGLVELRLPGGTYEVFATHGPFYSLGHADPVVVDSTTGADLVLDLVAMPVLPDGWISADLHVHSGASFDASLPVEDRVRAFIA